MYNMIMPIPTPFLFGLTGPGASLPLKMSRRFAYMEVSSVIQRQRFYRIPNGAYFRSEWYDYYDDVWEPMYYDMVTGASYVPGQGGPGGPGEGNVHLDFTIHNRLHRSSGPCSISIHRGFPPVLGYFRRGCFMRSTYGNDTHRYYCMDNTPSSILPGSFIKWGHFDPMQGPTKGYRADGPCQVDAISI